VYYLLTWFELGWRTESGGPNIEKPEGRIKINSEGRNKMAEITIPPKRKYCICSVL
jgi:hypothetical protein